MVIEHPIPPFLEWIPIAFLYWLFAVAVIVVAAVIVGFGLTMIRRGPNGMLGRFSAGLKNGVADLFKMSWRRVCAIACLIIHESIRKKVIVVCIVFLVVLMFAGWFLDPKSEDPACLYLSFVFSMTTYLVLLLALFLSSLSLPTDFKNKTIFTIVTKPVRSSEIVLGRILGLTVIGSAILILMAIASYFFVSFSLNHTHVVIENEDMIAEQDYDASNPDAVVAHGYTRLANSHKHPIEEHADGVIVVGEVNNHTHKITVSKEGDRKRYTVGPERGTIQAKIPVYGTIRFRNSAEYEQSVGINVGEEWDYRTYIAGATNEAAIWTFDKVDASRYPNGLPVEMTISVYRSRNGDIEQTIMGSLLVRNPVTGLTAETNIFNSEKYITKALTIPRKIDKSKVEKTPRLMKIYQNEASSRPSPLFSYDPNKEEYDLFEDFVVDGKVEVWLTCLDHQQYFGAAEPDLYLHSCDANLFCNFLKGYFGIWQEMVILISFGVLFSTFLSGPVAMVSTFGVLIAAFCKGLFMQVATQQSLGGGPFEAFERLVNHDNILTELPNTIGSHLIQLFDAIASGILLFLGLAIPSFSDFNIYADSVSHGFDISWNIILVQGVKTFSYVLPLFIVGYLILRNREVAK